MEYINKTTLIKSVFALVFALSLFVFTGNAGDVLALHGGGNGGCGHPCVDGDGTCDTAGGFQCVTNQAGGGKHCYKPSCSNSPSPTPLPWPPTCPITNNLQVSCSYTPSTGFVNFTATWDNSISQYDGLAQYIVRVDYEDCDPTKQTCSCTGPNCGGVTSCPNDDPTCQEWFSDNDMWAWVYQNTPMGSCNSSSCRFDWTSSTPSKAAKAGYYHGLGLSIANPNSGLSPNPEYCRVDVGPVFCDTLTADFSSFCVQGQEHAGVPRYALVVDNIKLSNGTNPERVPNEGINSMMWLFLDSAVPEDQFLLNTVLPASEANYPSGTGYLFLLNGAQNPSNYDSNANRITYELNANTTIGTGNVPFSELILFIGQQQPNRDTLRIGANIRGANGISQNNWIGDVTIGARPTSCNEGAGWAVDNVSVCRVAPGNNTASVLGATTTASSIPADAGIEVNTMSPLMRFIVENTAVGLIYNLIVGS